MRLDLAGGPRIEVTGDPATETWLGELLAGGLGAPDPTAPTWAIELRPSATALADVVATQTDAAGWRPAFSVEHRSLDLLVWEVDGATVLLDVERTSATVLDGTSVTVVADPAGGRWRFGLALLVYELIALAMRPSWLELHAASVVVDGAAVLVSGPKGAGKTTTAMATARLGAGLLANDRTFVRPDAAVGLPTPVKLLPGTAEALPELVREPIPHRGYLHTLAELPTVTTPRDDDEPMWLPPLEAVGRLGGRPAAGAHPLGVILFPEVAAGAPGVEVRTVDAEEAAALLLANLYRTDAAARSATVVEVLAGGAPAVPVDLVQAIADRVPVRRVRLGRAALDDPALIDALTGAW